MFPSILPSVFPHLALTLFPKPLHEKQWQSPSDSWQSKETYREEIESVCSLSSPMIDSDPIWWLCIDSALSETLPSDPAIDSCVCCPKHTTQALTLPTRWKPHKNTHIYTLARVYSSTHWSFGSVLWNLINLLHNNNSPCLSQPTSWPSHMAPMSRWLMCLGQGLEAWISELREKDSSTGINHSQQ